MKRIFLIIAVCAACCAMLTSTADAGNHRHGKLKRFVHQLPTIVRTGLQTKANAKLGTHPNVYLMHKAPGTHISDVPLQYYEQLPPTARVNCKPRHHKLWH